MTVPSVVPTVPSHVGTQKVEARCGFETPVPTVPTYIIYIIKGAALWLVRVLSGKDWAKWWEQGTVYPVSRRNAGSSAVPASSVYLGTVPSFGGRL